MEDKDFDLDKITDYVNDCPTFNITEIKGSIQAIGCVLLPWKFVLITKA